MKSGLLKKLLLFLLLTLFVNALLTAGVFTFTSRNVFANIKAKEIIPRARGLSEIMSQYQRGEITTRTLEILMNMTLDKSMWDASVHIYPGDGTWLSRAATFEGEEALGALHAYLPDILNGETNLLVTATADLGIVVGTPIYGVDAEVTGAVFLTKQLTEVNTALSGLNSALVISVLMVLCVMVVTAYFGSRSFTRPLLQMSKAAQAMAKGDFSVRADAHENDEVGQLGKSLNELSEALSQTIGALVLERNRLQSVLDGLREGIIAVDAGGRVTHCNPAAARLLGAKKGDDGLALARLTEVCPDILEEAGNGDLHYHAALMGDRRLQITVAGLLGQKNRHAGAVALIQDITEQTRLEQTRRDYVANVSHELRTPIASIRSIADSLHDGMVKKEEDKHRYYGYILRESLRLSRLIDDLLELSRLQSGGVALEKRAFELYPLLMELSERFEVAAGDSGLSFMLEAADDGAMVYANEDRAEQVLVSFLDNAVKYAAKGGYVGLAVEKEDGHAVLCVKNTGTIEETHLPHLFERFYKADSAHAGEGTGLGLAIAKEVMALMDEKIWVESSGGEVRFYITLRLA